MKPTPLSSRFDEALVFAVDLHREQARKATRIPYVAHLLGTAALVLIFGGDEDQAIAGLLHDAAEDQGGKATLERIRRHFGDRVAEIVDACTDTYADPKPEWLQRKKDYIARIPAKAADARLVSAADKLDNARAILMDLRREGARVWDRFNGGIQSVWYYRELVRAFREAGGGPIIDELDVVVTDMECLAGRTPDRMTAVIAKPRTVTLRDEQDGRDSRHLCAWLDERGNLHIDRAGSGAGDRHRERRRRVRMVRDHPGGASAAPALPARRRPGRRHPGRAGTEVVGTALVRAGAPLARERLPDGAACLLRPPVDRSRVSDPSFTVAPMNRRGHVQTDAKPGKPRMPTRRCGRVMSSNFWCRVELPRC
jgi:hypothetical protein